MCYPHGSLEQVTRTCMMCKVYPTKLSCPHQPLGLCRNRQVHPCFDVVHFKNVELELFDGCGYCKWARKHTSTLTDKPRPNTGFPGCCRPPKPSEYHEIKSITEWMAVNIIHGTPIPPEALQHSQVHPSSTVTGTMRNTRSPKSSITAVDKVGPVAIPKSPEMEKEMKLSPPRSHPLNSTLPEYTSGDTLRTPQKRKPPKPYSPDKNAESTTRLMPLKASVFQPTVPLVHHPGSTEITNRVKVGDSSSRQRKSTENGGSSIASTTNPLSVLSGLSLSSNSSDPGSGNSSPRKRSTIDSGTVTSDGFTDYLSDESDQELQRQAEIRAAELELAKQETEEFDAALSTVRHLSLQPPVEWNGSQSSPSRQRPSQTAQFSAFQSNTPMIALSMYSPRG